LAILLLKPAVVESVLPGLWAGQHKKALYQRTTELLHLMCDDQFDEFADFLDPESVRSHGVDGLRARLGLHPSEVAKVGKPSPDDVDVGVVSLGPHNQQAEVQWRLRAKGEWEDQAPARWNRTNDRWHLTTEAEAAKLLGALWAEKHKEIVRMGATRLIDNLCTNDLDACVALLDPDFVRQHGVNGVKVGFALFYVAIKVGRLDADDVTFGEVRLSPDARRAEIETTIRLAGDWQKQHPGTWGRRDGRWYAMPQSKAGVKPGDGPK
jgi:hypothetical protein